MIGARTFPQAVCASAPTTEHGPHPVKQVSRRMDATHGLAAILRDARKGALFRMRTETYSTACPRGDVGRAILIRSLSQEALA